MDRARNLRPGALTVVAVVGTVAVVAALGSMLVRGRPAGAYYDLFLLINGPTAIVLLWTSRMVLRRAPGHGAGRVLLAIGIVGAFHTVVSVIVDARLVAAGVVEPLSHASEIVPADLPLDASAPLWLMAWTWVPAPVLAITILPLIFPDGRLPSPRWRPVVGVAACGAGLLMAAFSIDAWPTVGWATEDAPAVVGALAGAGAVTVLVAAVAAVVALLGRWRATPPRERGAFGAVAVAALVLIVVGTATYPWQAVWTAAVLIAFDGLVVVYALAVGRYGLHDVEPALGRGAVSVGVRVAVVAGFLLLVVTIASLVGPVDTTLAALAVGVAALLIEPVRRRAAGAVDRVVYRRQADRSEVLARLARRAGGAPTTTEVLAEVADLIVRSSGARRVEVWLDDTTDEPAAVAGRATGRAPVLLLPIEHGHERFGELRLYAQAPADLVPDAGQLVGDVAHALGLILRNDRLTRQLHAQLDELRASRQRLVEAQDHARRGLERDIHDGAQVRLVSLRLRLGALRVNAERSSPHLVDEIDVLEREVDSTIRLLRDLARGLHPPILEQSGPVEALRAYANDLPAVVTLTAGRIGRHPRAVEGAIYFSCLEAMQNAVRHGGATEITIGLSGEDGMLRCRIDDDGTGFDPTEAHAGTGLANIADRASALGGQLRIDAQPGRGTQLLLEIPDGA